MKWMGVLFGLILSGSAMANIECSTKIGLNGDYKVKVDTDTLAMEVIGMYDAQYRGHATYWQQVRTRYDHYFLPVTYGSKGFQVRINLDNDRVWLCLDERTCGVCR